MKQRPAVELSRRQWMHAGIGIASVMSVPVSRKAHGQDRPQPKTSEKEGLLVHGETPMNAEAHLDQLVRSWVTPNEQFYIRSHAPVPKIDPATFRLSIEGLVERPLKLSLEDLKNQFGSHSVFATLTCAGNRRSEHSSVKKVGGVQWQSGAIGNALWTGPRLSDILRKAGVMSGAKHVWFEGLDEVQRDAGVIPFGASVPIAKVMNDSRVDPGTMLAFEMNDVPLPPDHGYPLRTVVPGYIGARSVKWLGRIIVSDRPSDNHYLATAYKLVTESTDAQWKAAAPLYDYVMNSVTCVPSAGTGVKPGPLQIKGFVLPPGQKGVGIQRVELSIDGGKRWTVASISSPKQINCWQLWNATIDVTAATKAVLVRATDSNGATQPQKVAWNLKGYMFNAWHETALEVES